MKNLQVFAVWFSASALLLAFLQKRPDIAELSTGRGLVWGAWTVLVVGACGLIFELALLVARAV